MTQPKDSEEVRRAMLQTCMEEMATVWKQGDPSPALMRAYWRVLGKYDAARIREGFDGALAHETFMPVPSTILKYIKQRPEDVYPELYR